MWIVCIIMIRTEGGGEMGDALGKCAAGGMKVVAKEEKAYFVCESW